MASCRCWTKGTVKKIKMFNFMVRTLWSASASCSLAHGHPAVSRLGQCRAAVGWWRWFQGQGSTSFLVPMVGAPYAQQPADHGAVC